MRIALAFFALFFLCAGASSASAQAICERRLFQGWEHCPPGTVRESADQFRARMGQGAGQYQAPAPRAGSYQQPIRPYYRSYTDSICFGCNPHSSMGTLPGGRPFGYEGQWDHYNWGGSGGYYSDYGYSRKPSLAGYKVWKLPYDRFNARCPTRPPPGTSTPKGYSWKCEQSVDANYGAFVRKGQGHVLRRIAARNEVPEGITVITPPVPS